MEMESSDESGYLLPSTSARGRRVPRIAIVFYLIVLTLHSFVFYAIWWRIVPFVNQYYVTHSSVDYQQDTNVLPTVTAQIFLLSNYMTPILGGLVCDLKHTRYQVIFVTRILVSLGMGLTMLLTYFRDSIPIKVHGYMLGVMLFWLASASGVCKGALIPFGVEQLDDDRNAKMRQSFLRLEYWFYELGRLLAMTLGMVDSDSSLANPKFLAAGVILLASFLAIPAFVACKRFYKFNELKGRRSLHALHNALGAATNLVESDVEWTLTDQDSEETSELAAYYRALLRRNGLLIMIFFTFGAFYTGDYFAGIIYPFQSKLAEYDPLAFNYMGPLIVMITLPIIDFILRKCGSQGDKADFFLIGTGMLFGLLSISISTFKLDMYRLVSKVVLSEYSQMCFYPAGYDLAYSEAPAHLKGTYIGLFLGLGTFFGGLIYIIWLVIPPAGVTPENWWYARVIVGSIMGFTLLSYIAAVFVYRKAKSDHRRTREHVSTQYLEDSINVVRRDSSSVAASDVYPEI